MLMRTDPDAELAHGGIEAEDLTVTYRNGHTALRNASFAIPRGTVTALVGVNGAGKSTLLNMICGEVHPARSACEQKGSVDRHRNCRLAYMAQQHNYMKEFYETSP